MTTVLLLRHAERDNDSLSEEGLERADGLAHVALKAGVTAIYTTDTERARQTVQPLADLLELDPLIYQVGSPDQIRELANKVQRDHYGTVVLIVGHNPTVPLIIDALGGDATSCSIGAAYDEFDDLCTVTIYGSAIVEVVNLHYGRPSP
jgi:broad specificity phosphatase PhoE